MLCDILRHVQADADDDNGDRTLIGRTVPLKVVIAGARDRNKAIGTINRMVAAGVLQRTTGGVALTELGWRSAMSQRGMCYR